MKMNWISINDKLPDTTSKDGIMVLVNLIPKHRELVYGNIRTAVFYKGFFHWDFNKGKIMTVTHWMPLPEPPKETIASGSKYFIGNGIEMF